MPSTGYVELRCRSAFSFLRGASLPEDLIERAAALGHDTLALSDRRRRLRSAALLHRRAAGRRARPGRRGDRRRGRGHSGAPGRGSHRLREPLPPAHRRSGRPSQGRRAGDLEQLEEHAAGLHCLAGGAEGPLARTAGDAGPPRSAAGLFPDRLAVDVHRHHERAGERLARRLADSPPRAACPSSPPTTCATPRPPAGRCSTSSPACAPRPRSTRPAAACSATPSAISRRPPRWRRCSATARRRRRHAPHRRALRVHARRPRLSLPRLPAAAGRDADRLPARAHRRRRARALGTITPRIRAPARRTSSRSSSKLDLAGYFLIVWDIVRFCRERGILCQGRGSAANSRGVLRARHHRRRSHRHGAALRALPLRGARRVARHRPRPAERRSARGGHPVRLPALRASAAPR